MGALGSRVLHASGSVVRHTEQSRRFGQNIQFAARGVGGGGGRRRHSFNDSRAARSTSCESHRNAGAVLRCVEGGRRRRHTSSWLLICPNSTARFISMTCSSPSSAICVALCVIWSFACGGPGAQGGTCQPAAVTRQTLGGAPPTAVTTPHIRVPSSITFPPQLPSACCRGGKHKEPAVACTVLFTTGGCPLVTAKC